MAHTKAGGSTRQQGNRRGKRRGVKLFGGQLAIAGNILIRQKGSSVKAGDNVGTGNDFTLYAKKEGVVKFSQRLGRKYISVV